MPLDLHQSQLCGVHVDQMQLAQPAGSPSQATNLNGRFTARGNHHHRGTERQLADKIAVDSRIFADLSKREGQASSPNSPVVRYF